MSRWLLAALFLLGTGLADPAEAHPLAPSLLDLREAAPGRITALWRRPQLLRVGARLEPVLPGRCRTIEPPVESAEGAAEVTRWTVDCGPAGLTGGTIAVRGLAGPARTPFSASSWRTAAVGRRCSAPRRRPSSCRRSSEPPVLRPTI